MKRINKLIEFMNHDWDNDDKWKAFKPDFPKQTQPLDDTQRQINKSQDDAIKRAYYTTEVDKDFDTYYHFNNDEERKQYLEYCTMHNSFRNINRKSGARRMKQIFYFLFLLALPLRIPFTPLLFLAAAIFSVFEKKSLFGTGLSESLITRAFTDEEPMNMALLLMFLFSSPWVQGVLYACLLIWAFLMWCEWGQEMLDDSGTTYIYGLPAMKPVIEFGIIFRVELAKVKSHFEVVLAFASIYMVFAGMIAPIFPLFFWQYVRIKYVISPFTKHSFRALDQ